MNVMEDPDRIVPPPLPIQLKMCITKESMVNVVVERVVNSHYHSCPQRHEIAAECPDGLCRYFTWHLNHHTSHRPGAVNCSHCALFETWIEKHSSLYCRSSCGLSLCNEMKKQTLKSRWQTCVEGFDHYLKSSPSSSLTRNSALPRHASVSSSGETTDQTSTHVGGDREEEGEEEGGRGYYSASTSYNSSPLSTQSFEPLDKEDEDPEPLPSDLRSLLRRESSEAELRRHNPLAFIKTQSQERASITSETAHLYRPSKSGVYSGRGSVDEGGDGDSFMYARNVGLEASLHFAPLASSSEEPRLDGRGSLCNPSSSSSQPLTRQSLAAGTACGKKRENFNSDSAISSTSENEELSSMESVVDSTTTTTPPSTFDTTGASTACQTMTSDIASTPSTVHIPSFENSGSSVLTASSIEMGEDESDPLSHVNIAELCQLTDRLQHAYRDEIVMLKNKGRPLYTSDPRPPAEVELDGMVHVDYNWRESYGVSALGQQPMVDQLRLEQQFGPQPTEFPEDSDTIERALDYRESVREYLQGQFYMQQTYSEHIHWRRVRQIGHGGQAKCFCIEDCVNNYSLCLKEEMENKKSLDEAFICLTLARLVSDAPPNIVEFFGASILPHYSGSNRLQLFLELMPGCLQEYVFENGPLPPETTLNYSYQIFEALDYLHQELRIIHCDIKPANLLIDYNCQRLKVADFGCAELLDEACHRKGFPENKDAGTLWYNPPDFYCSGNCSFGMDIWQAGCSVLFMVTGRRPWRHLCMDVDKQKAGPGLATLLKKRCCQMIGEQSERLHPLPAFLMSRVGEEGGAGVRQLLGGCLQASSARLSAKDLAYLAAVSETTTSYQRARIVKQLGYSPSEDVVERLQRENHSPQAMVDVYLGKEMLNTSVNSMPYAMLNGWLGSVPHRTGMTYGELYHLARQLLPVMQDFGECGLSVCRNNPRFIWKAVAAGAKPHMVRSSHLVDPSRALLLHPLCIQRTCC